MEIKQRDYRCGRHMCQGDYIHRYYLPEKFRGQIQPEDIEALYFNRAWEHGADKGGKAIKPYLSKESCIIRYQVPQLIKEIPPKTLAVALAACKRYHRDKESWKLTNDETAFLIAFNERLCKLEHDLNTECFRLHQEMHGKMADLEDYEIMVHLKYIFRKDHPLSNDDDDNILYEDHFPGAGGKTAARLEIGIEGARKFEEVNWNDNWGVPMRIRRNNALFNVPHCYLFRDLYDHSPVPFKHICCIGKIWVNIHVIHQTFIYL